MRIKYRPFQHQRQGICFFWHFDGMEGAFQKRSPNIQCHKCHGYHIDKQVPGRLSTGIIIVIMNYNLDSVMVKSMTQEGYFFRSNLMKFGRVFFFLYVIHQCRNYYMCYCLNLYSELLVFVFWELFYWPLSSCLHQIVLRIYKLAYSWSYILVIFFYYNGCHYNH